MAQRQSQMSLSASLGSAEPVLRILAEWRDHGPDAARQALSLQPYENLLMKEIDLRLSGEAGPRILLDGLWFCRPVGGITRVWDQILRCWQLPELFYDQSPLLLIDREGCLARPSSFLSVNSNKVDPLDCAAVARLLTTILQLLSNGRLMYFFPAG